MSVASVDDVATALGRSVETDAEIGQVEWWLSSAELQIVARLGAVADLDQDVVRFVEVEAVVARMTNPNGFQSETIDDYTYRLPETSRRVAILDEWWDLLTPDGASASFSIRAYGEEHLPEPEAWASPTDPL